MVCFYQRCGVGVKVHQKFLYSVHQKNTNTGAPKFQFLKIHQHQNTKNAPHQKYTEIGAANGAGCSVFGAACFGAPFQHLFLVHRLLQNKRCTAIGVKISWCS